VTTRFGGDLKHAREVALLARELFARLQPLHGLALAYGRLLEAACYFCEIGHYINDAAHHKHAYYIVSNVDFSGFTNRERQFIASLCRYHRKAMPSASHAEYQALQGEERIPMTLLIPVLRLADNLARSPEEVTVASCEVQNSRVVVNLKSKGALDLAEWGASRVSDAFQQVYTRNLVVSHERV
jgi:exopolyphosphatase/guanosine-5'-triphosphate,3'-diphosphate pyrophosphatase